MTGVDGAGALIQPIAKARALSASITESYNGHRAIDGDLFGSITDTALTAALDPADQGRPCASAWNEWLAREGEETYAYLPLSELLAAFATHSVRSGFMLLPAAPDAMRCVE